MDAGNSELSYISLEEVISIHRKTIQYSGGGSEGSLHTEYLESILQHMQNDDYYPTFEDKLTHLFFGVCKTHCFEDGNKRLAITLSAHFLLINGRMAIAEKFFRTMENISYHVASGRIDKELLKRIISSVVNGDYDNDEQLKFDILSATSSSYM